MAVSQVANGENASTHCPAQASASGVLDFEALKAIAQVESDDGSDIVIELIDLYPQGISQHIAAMREAADRRDWMLLLKRAAHTHINSVLPAMAAGITTIWTVEP